MVETTLHFTQFMTVMNLLNELYPQDSRMKAIILRYIEDIDARLSLHEADKEEMSEIIDTYVKIIEDIISFRFVGVRTEDPFLNNILDMMRAYTDRLAREQGVPESISKNYNELQDIKKQRIQIIKDKQAEHAAQVKAMEDQQAKLDREALPKETEDLENIDNI